VKDTVNQLIDCLTELTAVVEGKQDNFVDVRGHSTTGNPVGHVPNFTVSTPTLKEQLLGEMDELTRVGASNLIHVSDAKAIINSLIK
jgi:hypothetical protein